MISAIKKALKVILWVSLTILGALNSQTNQIRGCNAVSLRFIDVAVTFRVNFSLNFIYLGNFIYMLVFFSSNFST